MATKYFKLIIGDKTQYISCPEGPALTWFTAVYNQAVEHMPHNQAGSVEVLDELPGGESIHLEINCDANRHVTYTGKTIHRIPVLNEEGTRIQEYVAP